MRLTARSFLPLALLMFSAAASAHPDHALAPAGFSAGLLHPLLGLDHLAAMLMVGIWAASLGGHARWLVPTSFVTLMLLGASLSLRGLAIGSPEAGISASLVVLGLAVALAGRLHTGLASATAAIFAVFHGAAHGLELPQAASALGFGCGFLLSTLGLHAAGLALGLLTQQRWDLLTRTAGAATAVAGASAWVLN
jgi:urease accessory protein